MDIGRMRPYRTRLTQMTVTLALTAAAIGTLGAVDYASQAYGDTNAADAGRAQGGARAPESAPATSAHTPRRGRTMAAVRAEYGPPVSRRGPVGQPPITRWNYPGYHVYFEDNRVIHSVVPNNPEPLHQIGQLKDARP